MSTTIQEGYIPVSGGRVWYQIAGAGAAIPLLVLHGGCILIVRLQGAGSIRRVFTAPVRARGRV